MKKIYFKRLKKLADHLCGPASNRVHQKFDFALVSEGKKDLKGNYCGTAGCAVGELPAAFPRQWGFRPQPLFDHIFDGSPTLKIETGENTWGDVRKFFGLNFQECQRLFVPNSQSIYGYLFPGLKNLNDQATPRQVAQNIRAFIKWKQQQ